jgi:glycosyltransferase involved in cell wall biosynthesis
MIGQRGIPATFGGVEHHVEELGARLVERGHNVTVYCRPNYVNGARRHYRGMRMRSVPTIGRKHLDNIAHSAASTVDAMRHAPDIVHYHAIGSGLVAPLPRFLSGSKVVLTVHAPDHLRQKWGPAARTVLRTAAWMSARVPDATIVVGRWLADEYRATWNRDTVYIPNGVRSPHPRSLRVATKHLHVEPRRYLLFVGRIVPEKAPDQLIRAFAAVPGDMRLVVVGGSCFTDDYAAYVAQLARDDPRVVLAGYVYGEELDELYTNTAAFVQPSLLEGMPLTLLEAASYGVPLVVSDIPPNTEIVGGPNAGVQVYRAGDPRALANALRCVLSSDHATAAARRVRERVLNTYDWDSTADATEDVYHRLVGHEVPARRVVDLRERVALGARGRQHARTSH